MTVIFFRLHRNVRLRIGVGFVQRFLDVMLVPLMVIHFSRLYGVATAGLLTVVIAAATIACTFVGGHLADVYGRRPALLIGEVGASVAFVGLALANSPLWTSGFASYWCYLFTACLAAIARPANDAMLIDVSTPDTRTMIYTINYWSINVAFVGGALVGGFLYGGYFLHLLVAAAVLSCGVAGVTWYAITETAPTLAVAGSSASRGPRSMLDGYLAVLRDSLFARLFLAALCGTGIEVQIAYYVGVRLSREFDPQRLWDIGSWQLTVDGVSMLGILRAINTFLVVCLALLVGRMFGGALSDRQRLSGGLAVFTAGYMVLAVSNDPWLLIAATVAFTVGELMDIPVRQALLADVVRPEARTKYMAVYYMHYRLAMVLGSVCVSLGAVVSPLTMGLLYGVLGAAAIWLCQPVFRGRAARVAEVAAAERAASQEVPA